MGEHSFLMNTLSLWDQRTVPGICCLLSLPCEMIMWPRKKKKGSEAPELPFLATRKYHRINMEELATHVYMKM